MSEREPGEGYPDTGAPGQAKPRKYTRGIRASRLALTDALLASGLGTQVALAAKIAELENLDSPPKDSVSRAFREKSIDPATLIRIAQALNVEPHSLYLSASRQSRDEVDEGPLLTNGEDQRRENVEVSRDARQPASARVVVAVALLVTLLASWVGFISGSDGASAPISAAFAKAPGGVLTVAMMPSTNHDDMRLYESITGAVDSRVRISAPSTGALVARREGEGGGDAQQLRETLRAQLVLERQEERRGRYLSLAVHWQSGTDGGVLAADVGLVAQLARLERRVGAAAGRGLLALMDEEEQINDGPAAPSPAAPSIEVRRDYIAGRQLLDEARSDQTVRDASRVFSEVVQVSPEWSLGHAGLCDATLLNSWTDNEQQALQSAKVLCHRALQLGPEQPYAQAVWGHYLRRSGQAQKALSELAENRVDESVEQMGQLAEVEFALSRQTGELHYLDLAIARLLRLIDLEPGYWRWPWLAGTYYYYQGDLVASVEQSTAARELNAVPVVLANLGMAQLCLGDLQGMLGSFEQMTEIDPDSYLGHEYAGLARFYLGDFMLAVTLRRAAIERIGMAGAPEIHDMWGGLGDALRHEGDKIGAAAAYQRALEILERDMLGGIASRGDAVHRSYYHLVLLQLQSSDASRDPLLRSAIHADLATLEPVGLDRSARVRYAQLLELQGRRDAAREQAVLAVEQCSGLRHHPDIQPLIPG